MNSIVDRQILEDYSNGIGGTENLKKLLNELYYNDKIYINDLILKTINGIDDDSMICFIKNIKYAKNAFRILHKYPCVLYADGWITFTLPSYSLYSPCEKQHYILVKLRMFHESMKNLDKIKIILKLPHHLVEYVGL